MNLLGWVVFVLGTFVAVGVTLRLVRPQLPDHAHPIAAHRLPDATDHEVQTAADRALLIHLDDRVLALAATELDRRDHPQRVPYLLHALRRNAEHPERSAALIDLLARTGTEPLRAHGRLVGDLPPGARARLEARLGGPLVVDGDDV